MAHLGNTIVNGVLRVIGDEYVDRINVGSSVTTGALEVKGIIAGDSGSTGHGLYGGGGYHNAYNNILLHGDSSTATSGIAFMSDKVDSSGTVTNVNQPSDRAFIQYHACGITTATAEGTNPTLATSGENGRLVIGIGNDATDQVWLQTPGRTGLIHQVGNVSYVIPDTNNTTGSVGSATQPSYVEGGVIKACTYSLNKTVPSDAVFTDTNNAVTQTATTTDANYEVLFSVTADNTTRTEGARKNSNLKFNPSTGTLTATKFSGALSGNADTASKLGTSNVGSDRQPIYLNAGAATAGNYTVAHRGNAGKSNMNDVARLYPSVGMTNLSDPSNNYDNPMNGTTKSTGWHLYFDTSYSDDPNGTNAWVAQICNKAGSNQWWVRSRSGGTITNGKAWASQWRHLVTSDQAGKGGTTTPIYIDANGDAQNCSYTIAKSVPSDAVFTDTKNTAGSTDSSSKLFLIGATSQAANPQTYSHDTAYVGTDGCLYSGGTKVLTAHQDISGKVNKSGDTMSGVLTSSYKSGTWVNSLTQSAVALEDKTGSFGGWICGPTKNGRIAIATYQSNDDKLYLGYGERGRTTNSYAKQACWNGATGKWECDITGNAATVNGKTVAVNVPANAKFTDTTYSAGTGLSLSGTAFSTSVPRVTEDANTLPSTNTFTLKEYNGGSANLPGNNNWSYMLTMLGSDATGGYQLNFSSLEDGIYFRRRTSGTWGSWKTAMPFYSSSVSAAVNATTCTISDSHITTSSMIEPFSSNSKGNVITVTKMTVTAGQVVLTFPSLSDATSFKVRITNI